MAHPGGRPAKFETPEELSFAIEGYFEECKLNSTVVTMTGLALGLGFCDRQSLYDYQKRPQFSCLIKRALLMVENSYEIKACENNATGPIFVLKNMGWSDRQDIQSTNVNLNGDLDEKQKKEALDRIKKGLNEFGDYD